MPKQYRKLREAQKNLVDKQVLQEIEENNIGAADNRLFGHNNEASEALEDAYDDVSMRAYDVDRNQDLIKYKKEHPNDPMFKDWKPTPVPLVDEAKVATLRSFIETRREDLARPEAISRLQATEAITLQNRIQFSSVPREITMADEKGEPEEVIIPARTEKEVRDMVKDEFKDATKRLNQLEHVNELRDGSNPNAALPKRSRPGVEHD